MSKSRLIVSLTAMVGLLVLAGGAGIWAFPLRSPAQAASTNTQSAEKGIPPRVITSIQPVTQTPIVYPPEAQAVGIQGTVRMRVTINKDGSVMDIQVLSGHPELVIGALQSVAKWRYSPSDVERVTIVSIVFALPPGGAIVHPLLVHPLLVWREPTPSAPAPLEPSFAVRPVYPALAKTAGVQGEVTLRVTVDEDGSVTDIQVLSGHPLLVKAALDAVERWRFAPRDKPAFTDVTLDFTLPKGDNADNSLTPPMLIYRPNPPYTKDAKAAKLEGTVVLEVIVAADGTVSDVKVIKPLNKGLDENAAQAVKTWKFLPALKAGKPVTCKSTVSVNFKIP